MRLSMIAGDTKTFTLTLYDDAGEALDLEGNPSADAPLITFTARRYQHSADIVKTSDEGIELGAGDGEILITLDPDDTNSLGVPYWDVNYPLLWDVEVDTEDAIATRARGTLMVYPGVTVPA
jgi:hypothetical protein